MDHAFGPILTRELGPFERICSEPEVPDSQVERIHHVDVEEAAGDFVCRKCGVSFLGFDAITEA